MRLPIAASSLLSTTAGLLLLSIPALLNNNNAPSSPLFADAAQVCPGGGRPNRDGTCANPDMMDTFDSSSDDDDEEDSSDDDTGGPRGNPNAHSDPYSENKRTTCGSYIDLDGYTDAVYESKSFYQSVAWTEHPGKPDTCLSLDEILQICHSYRPNYHEPYIHFPAAYLNEMKRVVFIGGGDSMLLHESLKYPNLELVLGLELDQKVVRESLRYLHTQPHFDDPRVQWWFGDASKSLALLPREWFGTFDLVMVDLSETAMSLSVNDDLDIFGALALLMKPEGVFVKNELYFSQMSNLFDHSAYVYMRNYPMLCDQDWAMGSNRVDFLHPKIHNGLVERHNIPTLEYNPLDDEDEHYKLIKDYSYNDARKQGKCDLYDKEVAQAKEGGPNTKAEPVKPNRSTGVLLVVEAEGVTEFAPLEKIKDLLTAEGLTPLAPPEINNASGSVASAAIFIALEEGYVTAHYYPDNSYVGLEVVLWSKIVKHDDVRKALLTALDADDKYSSYRVIHGGMLGAKNWMEDINEMGPVNKNLRNCDPEEKATEPQVGEGPIPTDTFDAAVAASLVMLPKKEDKVIAVLCGKKGADPCRTAESLGKNAKVEMVVAIWSCEQGDEDSEKDGDGSIRHVNSCSPKDLKRVAKIAEGFSAIVVDPEASPEFVQSQISVFCVPGKHVALRDGVTFMTSLNTNAEKSFFSLCIKRLTLKSVRSSRITIDKTSQYGLIGTNNKSFVRKVVNIQEAIEKKAGVRTIVDKMRGGPVQWQEDYAPNHYDHSSYDERDALRQYTNQVPLASQSLYHFEVGKDDDVNSLTAILVKDVLDFVLANNAKFGGGKFAGAKRVDFSDEIGDGCVSAAIAPNGHLIATWDGAGRITLNILTHGEEYEVVPPTALEIFPNALPPDVEIPTTILTDHKNDIVDAFLSKMPASTVIAGREQMPRGANRVVNFKRDIKAIPGCTDQLDLCANFVKDGYCHDVKKGDWMKENCALSCGTCDKFVSLD
jgi:spermidine synthase/S-adenosylmethionine/arginine decarboxylase-like enzyme